MARPLRLLAGSLVRLADAAVIAAFVLGYAARYVRPTGLTWPLQLFGIPFAFAALALVGLTLLRLRTMSPRTRLVHALLVGLAAARFVPDTGGTGDPRPDDLRVVTYNVPMKWAAADDAAIAAKGDGLADYARAAVPHLFAFQDLYLWRSGRDTLIDQHVRPLRDSLGYRYAPPPPDAPTYIEVPVLARVPVERIDYGFLWRSPSEETPSEVTRVGFRWEGRPAALYNVHLRSYGIRKPWRDPAFRLSRPVTWVSYLQQYRDAYLYRVWETDTLRALLGAEPAPLLVTGDFNSTPHTWTYARLADGLQDAFFVAGRGWGATYHSRLPLVRIDYVLASPAWHVAAARVPALPLSDHRPVEVHLRWREE